MHANPPKEERHAPGRQVSVVIVSDVHSNLEALQAVLSRVEGFQVWCLGDLVGYGADPNEVIETLRERDVVSLLGNHDYAAVTGDTAGFNARAAMAVRWTRNALNGRSLAYLKSLPTERKVELGAVHGYLTHGSPDGSTWEYVDPRTHSQLFGHYLEKLGVGFIGLGHTHVPFIAEVEGIGTVFNPGSVGQPRDGDRRAAYAVLSTTGGGAVRVEGFRVEYDFKTAASKMIAAGLPAQYAERLYEGK